MKTLLTICALCVVSCLQAQTPVESVYIHTDRDVYAPQDQMNFKAYIQTGNRAASASNRLNLLMLNPEGKVVAAMDYAAGANQATGVMTIPDTLRDGEYRLLAWTSEMEKGSPEDAFSRKIFIRKSRFQDLFIRLTLDAPWYVQGEQAQVKAHITTADNKPYVNDQLIYLATKNGNPYQNGLAKTDENGDASLLVRIPATGEEGVILLSVQAETQKLRGSASLLIPGGGAPVIMDFYPEGGSLIEGIETKVGFRAVDFQGEPFDFAGVVLNQENRVIDSIKTSGRGIGSVRITAGLRDTLRVKITRPAGMIREIRLPKAQAGGVQLKLKEWRNGQPLFFVHAVSPRSGENIQAIVTAGGREISRIPLNVSDTLSFQVPMTGINPGIFHVSLVNAEGRIIAQRPAFAGPPAPPVITFEGAGKGKGKDSDPLNLVVKDAAGNAVEATLSLTVYDAVMSPGWNREPDIRSWFLLGSLASVLPPGYFSQGKYDDILIDNLVLAGIDTSLYRKQPAQDYGSRLVKYFQPRAFDKLAASFHRDRFFSEYFVSGKNDFVAFLKANKSELQDMGYLPGKPTQEDRIRQQLETGIPVLSVIKSLKPYTLTNNEIFFTKGSNSLQYPKGALIVVDGAEKGYNVEVLEYFSPYDIATIKVSDKISEILKYSADASGLIVITTKKAQEPARDTERKPDKIYDPLRFWNAEIKISGSSPYPLTLPKPELKSTWKMVILGFDSRGNFIESVK